jgi:hypothetical protein
MKLTTIFAGVGGLMLLAAVAIPMVTHCGPSVETARTRAHLAQVSMALQLYYLEYSDFPEGTDNANIIHALTKDNPRKISFYTLPDDMSKKGALADGWGRPVIFRKTPSDLLLCSAGKDGVFDTKDDITLNVRPPESSKRAAP